ncbi:hypothetical protein [Alcanivorax sp. 1008]|uniref:hypothetical protein n=1 Tax=Alcanivorax sp. 1008 TaxID=2816853 RepID=UPI001E5F0DBE|nr:hypothetical protein [Alcanivorax sp. 1008]
MSPGAVKSAVASHAARIVRYLWPTSVFCGKSAFLLWHPNFPQNFFFSEPEEQQFSIIVAHSPGGSKDSHIRDVGGVQFLLNRGSGWMWDHAMTLPSRDDLGSFETRLLSPAALCLAHSSPWRKDGRDSAPAHKLSDAAFIFSATVSHGPDSTPHEMLGLASSKCRAIGGAALGKLDRIAQSHPDAIQSGLLHYDEKVDLHFFDMPLGTLYRAGPLYSMALSPRFPSGLGPRRGAYFDELPPIIVNMLADPAERSLEKMVFTGGLRRSSEASRQKHRAPYVFRNLSDRPLKVVANDDYAPETTFIATITDSGELIPDSSGEFCARVSPLEPSNQAAVLETWQIYAGHQIASLILQTDQQCFAKVLDVAGSPSLVTLVERVGIPAASGAPAFEIPVSIPAWIEMLEDLGETQFDSGLAGALAHSSNNKLLESIVRHYFYSDICGLDPDLSDICITLIPNPTHPNRYAPNFQGLYRAKIAGTNSLERPFKTRADGLENLLNVMNADDRFLLRIARSVSSIIDDGLEVTLESLMGVAESAGIDHEARLSKMRILHNSSTTKLIAKALINLLNENRSEPTFV